ncbi:hypothetical protein JG688_00014040 [Phytophthora aleatoria]|uniref:Uncharacterized protein n=1 Tax=Phytophthora aleatoria TaxID=2496075 RepID=A0A8J5ME62_9STRA|nr:hypothetical protein JG688_00014040 [Phytophthora aleatoria]
MAHTGVSGSDSKILNSAGWPCDAAYESVPAFLHAREVSLHGAKCGCDRERFGDRESSAEMDTTANFGVGTGSSAILNSAATVFDPGGDRRVSAWAERGAHAFENANLKDGIRVPSNTFSMVAPTGFPAAVKSASAQFDPEGDNADLRSSDQGVSSLEPTCGDKETSLVDATSSATMHRLGSAEIDATEVGTCSVEDSVETLKLYYLALRERTKMKTTLRNSVISINSNMKVRISP